MKGKGGCQTKRQDRSHDRRRTLTVPEAAEELGISRNSAYDAIKAGELQAIRIGKRLLVPRAVLDRLLGGEAI
jgi:excisionase family DNA binding protein